VRVNTDVEPDDRCKDREHEREEQATVVLGALDG